MWLSSIRLIPLVQARAKDRSAQHVADFLDMSAALTSPIGDTFFCVAGKSTRNPSLNKWDVSPTDRCCQNLRNCTVHIPRLNYRQDSLTCTVLIVVVCEYRTARPMTCATSIQTRTSYMLYTAKVHSSESA